MKHIAAFLILATISGGSTAHAGNLTPPIIDQDLIIKDTKSGSSSSSMVLVALTGLIMFSVVASK